VAKEVGDELDPLDPAFCLRVLILGEVFFNHSAFFNSAFRLAALEPYFASRSATGPI
jgi:hypothetical protein